MLAVSVCSCEDNSNVGNSLSDTTISVVADSSFTVTGHSVAIPRVKARTIVQLLGEIKADNYGELTSDVVSEMMPVGSFVTDGVTEETIDRMRLVMYVSAGTGFTGDSIVPMQMSVYKLNKQLPNPIYSDFNPADYYNESDLLGTATYTASDMDKSTAEREKHLQSYYDNATYSTKYYELREARVELPVEIGRSIFREFKNNPSTFSSPDEFAKFFPGFYIKNSFGSGRVMNFQSTEIEMFYHRKYKTEFGTDTIVFDSIGCLAVTPEILVNNIINMKVDKKLQQQVADGERVTVEVDASAVGCGGGFLSEQSGRSHLTAGHAVDGIVDENNGDVLATIGGMNGFASAYGSQVAVALVGKHQFVGLQALDGCSHGRCASVSSFRHIDVDIVISKHGTTHRSHTNGIFGSAHFFDYFAHYLVHGAVAATGAVVHGAVLEQRGLLIDEIFGFYYIVHFHSVSSYYLFISSFVIA